MMRKKLSIGILVLILCSFALGLNVDMGTQLKPSNSDTYYEFGFEYEASNLTINSTHIGIDGRYFKVNNSNLLVNITNITTDNSSNKNFTFYLNNTGMTDLISYSPKGFTYFLNGEYINYSLINITNISDTIFLSENNFAPIITILSPSNESKFSDSITINYSVQDYNEDRYLTSINITNGLVYLDVNNLSDSNNTLTLNTSSLNDGVYNLTVESCENETVDLLCGSETFTIIKDLTSPEVIFGDNSLETGTYDTLTLKVNASVTDAVALSNVTINLYDNSGNLENSVSSSLSGTSDSYYYEFSGLSYEIYKINISAYDSNGNLGNSETRTYTLERDSVETPSIGAGSSQTIEEVVEVNETEMVESNVTTRNTLEKIIETVRSKSIDQVVEYLNLPITEKYPALKNLYLFIAVFVLVFSYFAYNYVIVTLSDLLKLIGMSVGIGILFNILVFGLKYLIGVVF